MQPLMIQGTSSQAGKTTLVAGLCRLFANRGLRVAPFKSQNMSLNSFVTEGGEEIARSTAVQAWGARQTPHVHMNPLLLKPKADDVAQLIVHGKVVRDVTAREYFLSDELQELKWRAIGESVDYLRGHYDLIIAEGAGSCAEPNLRRLDVVNMGLAAYLDARVLIVADIDKGGVFADLLGSLRVMELTEPSDVARIAGFLINKFRGDRDVLQPGLDFLEKHTGLPVAGVLPYLADLQLEEEDRVRERRGDSPEVDIAVLYHPHLSNATDLEPLADEAGVQLRYVKTPDALGLPDAVILPGTKNTTWDLDYLRRTGLETAVLALPEETALVGICGGFQMLGRRLVDPGCLESALGTLPGMALLDFEVQFQPRKTVVNRRCVPSAENPFQAAGEVSGYEIHSGQVRYGDCQPLFRHAGGDDGAVHPNRLIFGTFLHDLFQNRTFTREFVNELRRRRNLPLLTGPLPAGRDQADFQYERLAEMLGRHVRWEL